MMDNERRTKTFIVAIAFAAMGSVGYAGFLNPTLHLYQSCALLALVAATSKMKVKLPGIDGNMSVNLPFLLTAAVSLSSLETITITAVGTLVQCWPKRDSKFKPRQLVFNVSMMVVASSLASLVFQVTKLQPTGWISGVGGLTLATLALFLGQTGPVATVIGLSAGGRIGQVWWKLAQLSFPYYVVSAGVTSMEQNMHHYMGWGLALGLFPAMYAIHRSYRLYFASGAGVPQVTPWANKAVAGA